MRVVIDDGGRAEAGFKGTAGDCVARAIAIAAQLPYRQVYDALAAGNAGQRKTARSPRSSGRRTAREGIEVKRQWFKDYMSSLGFVWVPTMSVGSGTSVHLAEGELPAGRLVVRVTKHVTAVIDGVIHDDHDPSREGTRAVYGYWILQPKPQESQS